MTQKQLGNEKMTRLQNERETDRKTQEIDVLKALLAKLQKYSHESNVAIPSDLLTNRDFGGKKVRYYLRLQVLSSNLMVFLGLGTLVRSYPSFKRGIVALS